MEKEWKIIFYRDDTGISEFEEFVKTLSDKDKDKVEAIVELLKEKGIGLHRPYSDILKDGIHELRIKLSRGDTRTLYFFIFETYIILTHTFYKRTNEVPDSEINKALKYKQDFLSKYNKDNIKKDL